MTSWKSNWNRLREPSPDPEADEVIRKLRKADFQVDHVTESHYVMRHPDGRRVAVPSHGGRDVKRGVLRAIIRQAGLTVEEFLRL